MANALVSPAYTMTNRKLKNALLKSLGCTPQALSQRVNKKKKRLPMSTEDATYVIAHENGIDLSHFLDAEKISEIRSMLTSADGSGHQVIATRIKKSPRSSGRDIKIPSEFKLIDPLLPAAKLEEAKEMASLFPLLYVFENSVREVIRRVLARKFGADCWNTKLTSGRLKTIKTNAEARMNDEDTRNSWHQRRGDHPLDYVDLKDLEVFFTGFDGLICKTLGIKPEWMVQFLAELNPSRCTVCHMNPLTRTNAKDVRLKAERWREMIQRRLSAIAV